VSSTVDQSISEEILDTVVGRLVALASPLKIILFGSMARGEARPQSDLDLLIVEKEVAEPYNEALRLDRALRDLMLPLDLVIISEDQFNRYSRVPGTVYYRSLKEGQVLYAQ
jgi:predicted nucleotidyltransferase